MLLFFRRMYSVWLRGQINRRYDIPIVYFVGSLNCDAVYYLL